MHDFDMNLLLHDPAFGVEDYVLAKRVTNLLSDMRLWGFILMCLCIGTFLSIVLMQAKENFFWFAVILGVLGCADSVYLGFLWYRFRTLDPERRSIIWKYYTWEF